MQLWPTPMKAAIKERSSAKTPELCSRPKLTDVESGLKGQDERQRTVPLTPLATPTLPYSLDTANVVGDVKPCSKSTKMSEDQSLRWISRHGVLTPGSSPIACGSAVPRPPWNTFTSPGTMFAMLTSRRDSCCIHPESRYRSARRPAWQQCRYR
jgi:hypothetical protein